MKTRHRLTFRNLVGPWLLLAALAAAGRPAAAQGLRAVNLRCEYQARPLGVQARAPALGWEIASDRRNVVQTAYRVLVADDPQALGRGAGNCWDSGKTASGASIQVAYGGRPLQAAKTYYWQVQTWDNQGRASGWSAPAAWQMGLLDRPDWHGAAWIGHDRLPAAELNVLPMGDVNNRGVNDVLPLLRKEFVARKAIKRATAFISGLGQFELLVNGEKVGSHFLDPGWTKYDKQAQYVAFDLTKHVRPGPNALGVLLGNGFYYIPPVPDRYRKLSVAFGYPKLICRLALEYRDGSRQDVVSDASWKTTAGPVTFSSIYGGEDYDARREQPGWADPAFDDRAWRPVVAVDGPPELVAQQQEPLAVTDTFAPQRVAPGPQGWVYDFGQNASGIVEVQVRGRAGDTLRITPSELMLADNTPNQIGGGAPYYFQYVLKGHGVETWRPRFSYYGFRFAQVAGGVPAGQPNPRHRPEIVALTALHTRNAAARVGTFTCSNELFNRTDRLIDWAIQSNLASVFTDCPHREKLGWLEETHLMGSSLRYNYDIATLCRKAIGDMRLSQAPDGLVPAIAPEFTNFGGGNGMFRNSPEWGSSSIILPWYVYQWYGDRRGLAESYPMMQRYLAYLAAQATGHIIAQGLGDWYDLGPKPPGVSQLTPMGVTATATYHYDLLIVARIARLLGKPADAAAAERLAGEVRTAFNDRFFNRQTKQYATGSQTANAMAVYMGLVPAEDKAAVVANIVQELQARNNSLTAGDIGYRYLLRVLDDAGRSDVIFAMNNRSDVPGYGYQLARGATALTESWQALPDVSNNHFMLGHLMEWFYGGVGGIRPAEGAVAFDKIDIRPEPVGDLTSAEATYRSPYGLIASAWKKTGPTFELTVTVPANTSATVYLPATAASRIAEGGQAVAGQPGLAVLGLAQGKARIKTGSGTYHFVVSND